MNILKLLLYFSIFLLTGCPLESEEEKKELKSSITLERIDISASSERTQGTSLLTLVKGNKQSFVAIGYYSDNSSKELTNLNIWRSNNEKVGYFVEPGKLIGNSLGIIAVTAFKDGITSNTVDVEVTNAVITAITVTPSQVSVANGQTQQLLATATYSDGTSSDVSSSVTWTSNEPQTATVTPTGLLSGNAVANTTVEAIKDGITSNTVDVEVYACRRTGTSCVDLFDTGSGTLFTNTPSKMFLDSIGGSVNDGFTQEIGTSSPTGDFYLFDWNKADLLCDTYNTNNIAGRTNWRLATENELRGLFNANGNMFTARGWAVRLNYWTSTARGPGYYNFSLRNGNSGLTMPGDYTLYASCVSVP
ncbi:BIG2 domain-containing protein [Vibrio chagasii]|nr:BIG2 domain-containing protein [Vibrio chagasii]CAH6865749.1 BIG2 domain-containing protein [Vibrio chagasii]CAH6867712.1 BIG2 domain-containing protein [Vibrio chagasii]CAH7250055.1 BIG2 domain-containing protein [Vibrio chagasii]